MKGLLFTALVLVALAIAVHSVPAHAEKYYPGSGFDDNGNYHGFGDRESGYQKGQDAQAQKEQRDQQERNSTQSSYRR